jgi:tRNA(fMet)-specific endonuclease VapC
MIGELMLDTKAVSALVKGQASRLAALLDKQAFCISVITEAELRFGLARRPVNPDLRRIVEQFLATAAVKPWDSDCAQRYALLRAELETRGTPLAPMDLLIAAHALTENCTLVSADKTFVQVPDLRVVDWSLAATTRKAAKVPKSS